MACVLFATAAASPATTVPRAAVNEVRAPPATLALDPFYQKYVDAGGIPITTSARVPDSALFVARDIVLAMLAGRPDLRAVLVAAHTRVGIMAIDEMTTDLPEQRDWKKPVLTDQRLTACEKKGYADIARMTDREYWNMRTRGMGGTYTTGAAENILGVPGTRYFGENILVHEFSHSILNALRTADAALYARVERAYADALARGLWTGHYATTTVDEYWAEGTQFWFNSNMAYRTDRITIVSADDLHAHDPALYAVLEEVYRASHHIGADVFYNHPARMNSPIISTAKSGC
jgi:hypothetical protein